MGYRLRAVSIVLVGSTLASGPAALGCSFATDCNDIGCESSVVAEIGFLDGTWPDGLYEIELVADGDSHLCSFSLPQEDEASIHPLSVRCEGDNEKLDATLTQQAPCKKERVGTTLMEACAAQTAQYTLDIELHATPNKLQLRATRDAELLTEQQHTVEYATYRPNGGACKPVCRQSSTKLLLDGVE